MYRLAKYRDWVMKQKAEEGIKRQNLIIGKDIEAEVRMLRGMRSSKILQGNTEEVKLEMDSVEINNECKNQLVGGKKNLGFEKNTIEQQNFFEFLNNSELEGEQRLKE